MKISVNVGKQNKIHILCDGEYKFTVDAEYWFSSPYHGTEIINDEEQAAFFDAVGSRCAFIAGLRLLSYRDHTEKELVLKLVQKGHKKDYAQNAVQKLKEYKYIDDERVAEIYARDLFERKGMSINSIISELCRKGIPREIALETVEAVCRAPSRCGWPARGPPGSPHHPGRQTPPPTRVALFLNHPFQELFS